jgi:hypothetical protein
MGEGSSETRHFMQVGHSRSSGVVVKSFMFFRIKEDEEMTTRIPLFTPLLDTAMVLPVFMLERYQESFEFNCASP